MPWMLVNRYKDFRGTVCFHLHCRLISLQVPAIQNTLQFSVIYTEIYWQNKIQIAKPVLHEILKPPLKWHLNMMTYLFISWTDCGVKFSAKSSLYVHLKKHSKSKSATGDKVVYHCPIEKCTRTYTCKSSLRQHMLKFHTPVLGKWHCIMTVWHHVAVAAKEPYIKSDVWLTVHRNSVWIRKTN